MFRTRLYDNDAGEYFKFIFLLLLFCLPLIFLLSAKSALQHRGGWSVAAPPPLRKRSSVTRRIWQRVQPVTWSPRGPSCSAATLQERETAINPVTSIRLRRSVSPDPRRGSRHDLPFLPPLSRSLLSLVVLSGRTAARVLTTVCLSCHCLSAPLWFFSNTWDCWERSDRTKHGVIMKPHAGARR